MRRHDFDAVSFVSGLAFAGFGLVLLGGGAIRDGLALPWTGPVVAIGVAALIVVAARPRPDAEPAEEDPRDESAA